MSTGITPRGRDPLEKHLRAGKSATTAKRQTVRLSYTGAATEDEILSPTHHKILGIDSAASDQNQAIQPNAFVFADNEIALKNMIHSGSTVDLIYTDPPFMTGKAFITSKTQSSAYNDNLGVAEYIEFMRQRFLLMREVLNDTGSIYVHIGPQAVAYLKILLDEVFGISRFRAMITRRKVSSKNSTRNNFPNLVDYVLYYTKTNKFTWNQQGRKPEKNWIEREYGRIDERGRYKLVPVHAPGIRNGATGLPWRGVLPPPGKHWQRSPKDLDQLDADGFIYWSKNGNPRRKVYLDPNKSIPYTDYWHDFRDLHHQTTLTTGYPTEKNVDMIKMIISTSSNEGDVVLDPFSGSGTTLQAAEEQRRAWIGIDNSLEAASAAAVRLSGGLEEHGDYVGRTVDSGQDRMEFDFDTENNSQLLNCSVYADARLTSKERSHLGKIFHG